MEKKVYGIIGVMAKDIIYGYWSGHPCSVGVANPRTYIQQEPGM